MGNGWNYETFSAFGMDGKERKLGRSMPPYNLCPSFKVVGRAKTHMEQKLRRVTFSDLTAIWSLS